MTADEKARRKRRFRRVFAEIFNGNAEELCRTLEVNRSTLTRYQSGKIPPSRKTLRKIAALKGVSFDWLLGFGSSEAIVFEKSPVLLDAAPSSTPADKTLPLTKTPSLEVPTSATPGFLGTRRDTIGFLYRATRYWLKAPHDCPSQFIRKGDYCLIETIPGRAATPCESSEMRVFTRNDVVVFDVLGAAEQNETRKIFGVLVRIERDLWE